MCGKEREKTLQEEQKTLKIESLLQ